MQYFFMITDPNNNEQENTVGLGPVCHSTDSRESHGTLFRFFFTAGMKELSNLQNNLNYKFIPKLSDKGTIVN